MVLGGGGMCESSMTVRRQILRSLRAGTKSFLHGLMVHSNIPNKLSSYFLINISTLSRISVFS